MYTHNWWHAALFRLDMDDAAASLALFDTRVWGVRKTYVQDQVNAVSLLSRLELRGVDVGDRWTDVAAHVLPRIHDRQNAFLDLHYLYALARAGEIDAVDRTCWQGWRPMPRRLLRPAVRSGARSPFPPPARSRPMRGAGSSKRPLSSAPCCRACSCSAAARRSRRGSSNFIRTAACGPSAVRPPGLGYARELQDHHPRRRNDPRRLRHDGLRYTGSGDAGGGDGAAASRPDDERRHARCGTGHDQLPDFRGRREAPADPDPRHSRFRRRLGRLPGRPAAGVRGRGSRPSRLRRQRSRRGDDQPWTVRPMPSPPCCRPTGLPSCSAIPWEGRSPPLSPHGIRNGCGR